MCTVTFIPSQKKVFITSSRDESALRKPAAPPAIHDLPGGPVIFPRDTKAGGTWIAAHENGNTIVLLNGAFTNHHVRPSYRKSRGLVLLDIINDPNPLRRFQSENLVDIEPFTIILFQQGELFECRWSGLQKKMIPRAHNVPAIWSSVTLYNEDARIKREGWFDNWIQKHPNPARADIIQFHKVTPDEDHRDGILMNRNNLLFTVSITLAELTKDSVSTEYIDVRKDTISRAKLHFPGIISQMP